MASRTRAKINVRRAGALDTGRLAKLLNEIIARGGTTALTDPVNGEDLAAMMNIDGAIWHVAEDEQGDLLGFQWIDPHPEMGRDVAHIATFAKLGKTGLGIGSSLFDVTVQAARAAGYAWINAEIRADNEGGLIYYQSRGFEDYGLTQPKTLGDGTVVAKVLKRYDL